MRLRDSSCLYSFHHAINIVTSGLGTKNQMISMFKPDVFFLRSDLTVGIFSMSTRTESVKYRVDHTDRDTVDIFQLDKRCYSFACHILFKALWLLEALFKEDLCIVKHGTK